MADEYKDKLKKAQDVAQNLTVKLPDKGPYVAPLTYKGTKKKAVEKKKPVKTEVYYEGKWREEDLEVDDPAHILVKKFREGEIDAIDLSPDDKFVIIRYLREEEGMQQDKIAEELGVTRRTVINYCNKIKKIKAQDLADTTVWEIGGELYDMSLKAMRAAMQEKKYQQVAYVFSTMVSTLQSMGLIFKMPKQSQVQQNLTYDLQVKGADGFKQLKGLAEKEEINLDNVFNELMSAVRDGKLDEDD